MSVEFRRMIKARTHGALESRAKEKRPTGGKAFGYRNGTIDDAEARIVREILELAADGVSDKHIATRLNAQRIPSPGSSWNRTKRRAAGWMNSPRQLGIR
jgi:DNA invertase Pin-like site-specific DNA recombinase